MMDTCFATPHRADKQMFAGQIDAVSRHPVINSLLEIVDGILAVLNEHRQILSLNHHLLDMLGIDNAAEILGLRPGEALGCIHSEKGPGGCGTSEFCSSCGAAVAIVTSLCADEPVERMPSRFPSGIVKPLPRMSHGASFSATFPQKSNSGGDGELTP